MLSLTRKSNESIIIDGNIEIKILSVSDGKVRIGISAPKNVEIHRKEIYDLIQTENRSAALTKGSLSVLKDNLANQPKKP